MCASESPVAVNFRKPFPVFPLPRVTLLPQQILPLHIFEPRYVQMVRHVLDGAGLIAMGVYDAEGGAGSVREAVCIGHIVKHMSLPDSRCNIFLQGVCRARIIEEVPLDEDHLYRRAMLEPVGVADEEETDMREFELKALRGRLHDMFSEGELSALGGAEQLRNFIENDSIPISAILEVVSFTMVQPEQLKYSLLREGSLSRRVDIVLDELRHLTVLLKRAKDQHPETWPKGLSWN